MAATEGAATEGGDGEGRVRAEAQAVMAEMAAARAEAAMAAAATGDDGGDGDGGGDGGDAYGGGGDGGRGDGGGIDGGGGAGGGGDRLLCREQGDGEAERARRAEGGARVPYPPGAPVRMLRAREGSCGANARTRELDLGLLARRKSTRWKNVVGPRVRGGGEGPDPEHHCIWHGPQRTGRATEPEMQSLRLILRSSCARSSVHRRMRARHHTCYPSTTRHAGLGRDGSLLPFCGGCREQIAAAAAQA